MNPIELLENTAEMNADDKGSILLVHGGLKPCAMVVMQGAVFPLGKEVSHLNATSLSNVEFALRELHLHYVYTTVIMENASDQPFEHGQEVVRFFISREKASADRLRVLFNDIKNNHHEVGILLGYPKTAVDSFLTDDALAWSDHPVSTAEVSSLNIRLLGHRLSKQHWREEVRYLEEMGEYIKTVSPTIYRAIVRPEV